MKRLLLFAALAVAIGSVGTNMLAAHAQTAPSATLTPAQAAAIQQQLEIDKATLANLEMEAGTVPPADTGTPSAIPPSIAGTGGSYSATAQAGTSANGTSLTPAQASAFRATLSTLAQTLTQLNTSIAANTTLTPTQQQAVAGTLGDMSKTLVAMANTVATANNAGIATSPTPATASIAAAQPSPASQPGAQVAANTSPATPSAETTSAAVAANTSPVAASAASVPQTAQASSLWSFAKAHWPTIVIVLLIIAILAILFWPEKESVKTVTQPSGKPKTSAPTSGVSLSHTGDSSSSMNRPSAPANPQAATPVANAVAAPAHQK